MAIGRNARKPTPPPPTGEALEEILNVPEMTGQCKKTGEPPAMTPPLGEGATESTPKPKTPTPKKSTPATPKPEKPTPKNMTLKTTPKKPTPENTATPETTTTQETTATPATPATPEYPIRIDGHAPSKSTITLTKLKKLPILNEVIVRTRKNFKTDEKRMSREEAWVGTERGEVAEKACNECSRGNNPFTLCCVVDSFFKGACANCHYGGNSSRCSFYQDAINAEAHLMAEQEEAPVIPGMAPANYYGGTLTQGGFKLHGSPDAPLLEHVPIPERFQATPGVARGGQGQRLAPTPAPQVGFGSTDVSRLAHASSLTPEQRMATSERLKAELKALEYVMAAEGDESVSEREVTKGTKRKRNSY